MQRQWVCGWCHEWAFGSLDPIKMAEKCFDPNRDGEHHEWCESDRFIPADEADPGW